MKFFTPIAPRHMRGLLVMHSAAALAFASFAFYAADVRARAAIPNKTLVFCMDGTPEGFDPGLYTSTYTHSASSATIYNRLVDFERGATKLIPALAERWEVSKDGRVYTFYLRRGVKFHTTPWFKPTRELNADDVLFTFERMRNPDMPFRRAYPTVFPYWQDTGFDRIVEKIEAIGDDRMAVRFTLKEANAIFLSNLALGSFSILSSEYAAQLLKAGKAARINQEPVGTGPFIFHHYTKDATIRFDDNPDYWKPEDVQLSRLIFAITLDPAVRLQKIRRNECQVSADPRPSDISVLKSDPNIQILSKPGLNLGMLVYNVTHKPLDDVRVRRALDRAIDKKAIIQTVFEGRARAVAAPMPPTQWSYDTTLQDAPRDLKKAKALLAQAGYPNGFTIQFWHHPKPGLNPNPRLMAEMIQADWAQIGVKAQLMTYEFGEYLKRAHNGEHDVMTAIWIGDNGDPDNWLSTQLGCAAVRGSNFSKWCYKPFEDIIQRAARVTNIEQRAPLYREAQRIFKREQPFTSLFNVAVYQLIRKNVKNFKIDPFGHTLFYGVGLE